MKGFALGLTLKQRRKETWKSPIDHLHVTSLPPCWRTITKDSSLASIVSSSNMATTSLSFGSLGIDCKPLIVLVIGILHRLMQQFLPHVETVSHSTVTK